MHLRNKILFKNSNINDKFSPFIFQSVSNLFSNIIYFDNKFFKNLLILFDLVFSLKIILRRKKIH